MFLSSRNWGKYYLYVLFSLVQNDLSVDLSHYK